METSQTQDSDLFSPAHIFTQEDSPILQNFDKDQYISETASKYLGQDVTLLVTTKEESFTGKVINIHNADETTLVEFANCYSPQGEFLSHRQYFTFDILQIQEMGSTQDSEESFEIFAQQPPTPQFPPSAPSQEPSQPAPQPMEDSQQDPTSPDSQVRPQLSPDLYENFGIPESLEYDLPVQNNGTVDTDLLKLHWKTYKPQIRTFSEFCKKYNIIDIMCQRNALFAPNAKFVELKRTMKSKALHYYATWATTYHIHKLDFGTWSEDKDIPKPVISETPEGPNYNIDLARYHIEALEVAQKTPRHNQQKIHKLREIWSNSLMATHSLPFPEWLEKVDTLDLSRTMEDKDDLDIPTWADIKPHDNLFHFKPHYWQKHSQDITKFILEGTSRQIYQGDTTQIPIEDMFPGKALGHIFIPNYIHVPQGVLSHLKLYSTIHELPHLQHILWMRLKEAQRIAYETEHDLWSEYYTDNADKLTTPFALRFLNQLPFQTPFISNIQIIQHLQAHEYCKKKGGPKQIDGYEFYDLFLRPLEFLCGQGMPLHTSLIESVTSFATRANLIKILLEIAGFSIHDSIPEQMHMFYSEISKIRHIQGINLTPQWNPETEPYHRLEAMPRVTHSNKAKVSYNTVDPSDFSPTGRFHGFVPNHFMPMPFCDEHALHYHMLKCYKVWKQSQLKPVVQTSSTSTPPSDTKTTPEKKKPPSQPTPAPRHSLRPHVGLDTSDAQKSWVNMMEQSPPNTPQRSQPQEDPVIQLSYTQLKELVNPSTPKQATRPQVKSTPAAGATNLESSPELIFTQSQWGPTMFPSSKNSPTQLKALNKSSVMDLPSPKYHPSIPLKPTWVQTGQIQKNEKFGDPELIWSCKGHYNIPDWAKQAHSAITLEAQVDRTRPLAEQEKTRYRRMPKYHQFPADGLNYIKDIAIYLTSSREKESIIVQITTQSYKNLNSKSTMVGAPVKSYLTLPLTAFGRFIVILMETAHQRLRPAWEDVQQEDHVLYMKHHQFTKISLEPRVIISSGHNGLERMMHITLNPNVDQWKPEIIEFPWIRLAQFLQTCKDLQQELRESGIL